jgi:hypothetical protein
LKKIVSPQSKSKQRSNSPLWLTAFKVGWRYRKRGLSHYELIKTITRALRQANLRTKGMSKEQQVNSVILFEKNRIFEHPQYIHATK